mgnify:CR=1 FL=1
MAFLKSIARIARWSFPFALHIILELHRLWSNKVFLSLYSLRKIGKYTSPLPLTRSFIYYLKSEPHLRKHMFHVRWGVCRTDFRSILGHYNIWNLGSARNLEIAGEYQLHTVSYYPKSSSDKRVLLIDTVCMQTTECLKIHSKYDCSEHETYA